MVEALMCADPLVLGEDAIATTLGITRRQVSVLINAEALPLAKIGPYWGARKSTLDAVACTISAPATSFRRLTPQEQQSSGLLSVPGFRGLLAAENGSIYSLLAANNGVRRDGPRLLKPFKPASGYLRVRVFRDDGSRTSERVQDLIAGAFLDPRPSPFHEVGFKDGDRKNCAAGNLQWATLLHQQ